MIKTAVIYIVIFVLTALARFTGYGQGEILTATDQAAVLAYSEAIMDNLFEGLTSNDYTVFSRDFDRDMQKNIPASDFVVWKQTLDENFGNYLSRKIDQVTRSDEFYVVVYQAEFEQDERVIIGVAFHAVEPYSISHLWFDSEKPPQK